MATLRDLGSDPNVSRTEEESLAFAHRQLEQNMRDLPFTITYLFDDSGDARLAATNGITPGHPAAPVVLPSDGAAVSRPSSIRRRSTCCAWRSSVA